METFEAAKKAMDSIKKSGKVSFKGIEKAPNNFQRGYMWGYLACISDLKEEKGKVVGVEPALLEPLIRTLSIQAKEHTELLYSRNYFMKEELELRWEIRGRLEKLENKFKALETKNG